MTNKLDKWIFGDGLDGTRQYLIHTHTPTFVGELFAEDDPEGVLAGLSCELRSGESLANIVFYDEPPTGDDLEALLKEASDAVDAYDGAMFD